MKTVEYLNKIYVIEGTGGLGAPAGAIFLDTLSSAKLVELCNLLISNLDLGNRIKMFQNKGKGVKRVTDLLLKYEAEFAEEAKADAEEAAAEAAFEAPVTEAPLAEAAPEPAADVDAAGAAAEAAPTGDCDEQAAEKRADLTVPKGKVRDGSKQAALVDLLKRPEGASIKEIVVALKWLPHTTRGAISRDVKKRLGYTVTTDKVEGRGRVYRIEA